MNLLGFLMDALSLRVKAVRTNNPLSLLSFQNQGTIVGTSFVTGIASLRSVW